MKKSILNLGKALNKADQKLINGGLTSCNTSEQCSGNNTCCSEGACIDTSLVWFAPYCF